MTFFVLFISKIRGKLGVKFILGVKQKALRFFSKPCKYLVVQKDKYEEKYTK